MAGPTAIPYARQQAYDNSDYVRTMAQMMMNRADNEAQARRQNALLRAQGWNRVGDIAMAAMGGIGDRRDAERKLKLQLAQQDIENQRANAGLDLQRQTLAAAADERKLAREERQKAEYEAGAKEITDDMVPGAVLGDDVYGQSIAKSRQANRFRTLPAQEALPAWETPAEGDAMADAGPAQEARPTLHQRKPNYTENMQAATLERQREATAATILNQLEDNRRQAEALGATIEARKDANELRRDSLQIRQFMLDATQDQRRLSNMLSLSGAVKGHPAYSKMLDFESGLQAVETGLKQGNGLGDIAAINAFQRLVDPGVSVREGDVKLLESAIALGSKLQPSFWVEKLSKGARLPEDMRAAMQKASRELYVSRAKTYNETVGDTFRRQAKEASIPFSLIGRDFPVPDFGAIDAAGGVGGAGKPTVPRGPDGKLVIPRP